MTERKVREPLPPLAGLKGRVSAITYGHAVKIGMPSKDRYDPKHAMDVELKMTVDLADGDNPIQVMNDLVLHVNQSIEKIGDERLEFWTSQLGVGKP